MITTLMAGMPSWAWWLIALGIIVILVVVVCILCPIAIWFRALVSGAHISIARLIGMRFRKVNVGLIVDSYISARKAGLNLTVNELEAHFMAGGNVYNVVTALIAAHSAKIPLSVDTAKAIDLAGRDVLEAINNSVTPKIMESDTIAAISKDGVELRVRVRVTVRTNISRLGGGAGEDTILARVGEGIVTTVGAKNYNEILENPDLISKTVQDKNLDAGTAYEILSIDVADVDVGKNVGAKLKVARADADKQVAQAKAEERRAMAEAAEQEMIARTQEMKAQVLLAESEVPKAMAEAFRNGQLGVMDYYRMQNMVADTSMRNSLAGTTSKTALEAPTHDGKDKKKTTKTEENNE